MPKVSVILPVFQGEEYLAQAIESCLNQTVKPFEVIIIDDGSTDKTVEIIKSWEELVTEVEEGILKKSPIKLYQNEQNEGIGFSRKKGVDLAKGDYISFCSADDVLEPNFIEAMLNYAKYYPDSILYSDFLIIDENGNKKGEARSPEFNNYDQFVQAVLNSARQNKMFVCYNIFGPAKLLKENNFDESMRFGEDLEHLLRCILVKNVKFVHIPWILFKYREHGKMVTQQRWNEIAANNRKTFDKINSLIRQNIL